MPENQPRMLGMQYLVCRDAGASPFDDDLEGVCADCGRMLSFRPYLAEESPKLCIACFGDRKSSSRRRAASPDA